MPKICFTPDTSDHEGSPTHGAADHNGSPKTGQDFDETRHPKVQCPSCEGEPILGCHECDNEGKVAASRADIIRKKQEVGSSPTVG